MKRYLIAMAVPLVLGPLILIGLALLAAGYPPDQNAQIMIAKLARAHQLASPKIVLIGGSNVTYGFRALEIEQETGTPAMNLALTADFGVDYLLFLTRQALRRGDTVIVAFEYSFYDRDELVTSRNAPLALWNDVDWVRHLPPAQQLLWARNLTIGVVFGALRSRLSHRSLSLPVGVFDARGDNLSNDVDARALEKLHPLPRNGPPPFRFVVASETVRSLDRFFAWCRREGVRPTVAWPTFDAAKASRQPDFPHFIADLGAYFKAQDLIVLGEPDDGLLPEDLLFDTVWHASAKGAALRTRRLIDNLRAAGLVAK